MYAFMDLPKKLTPEQVRHFHDEGYVIVPDVFDPADLEPLREEMEREIDRKARALQAEGKLTNLHADLDFEHRLTEIRRDSQENGEAIMRHLEGHRGGGFHAPEMFDVISHPQLLAAAGDLLGSEEIVASSVYRLRPKLPQIGRGVVPWHQDSGYLEEHCDEALIITCWVPLVDATVENGCMQILPRVHHGKLAKHHTGGNMGFLVIKDENLPDDPRKAVTAACPRGGVVFMTNRTPHCSTPNYSDHIRWSVDLRFQAAETPNNVGLWPELIDEQGDADSEFYDKVAMACYPPEADFLVHSATKPAEVTNYEEFVRRRETYDRTNAKIATYRRWPESVAPVA